MSRSLFTASMLLTVLLLACACRTHLTVSDVTNTGSHGRIDGLPFRVRETYTLRVLQFRKKKQEEGTQKGKAPQGEAGRDRGDLVEIYKKEVALANPHRLFALNTRSEMFSKGDLTVEYQPDSTLKIVDLKETRDMERAEAAVGTFGGIAKEAVRLDEAVKEREAELAAAAKTKRDAEREAKVNAWAEIATLESNREQLRVKCAEYKAAVNLKDEEAAAALGSALRGLMIEINKSYIKLQGSPLWSNIYAVDLYNGLCK